MSNVFTSICGYDTVEQITGNPKVDFVIHVASVNAVTRAGKRQALKLINYRGRDGEVRPERHVIPFHVAPEPDCTHRLHCYDLGKRAMREFIIENAEDIMLSSAKDDAPYGIGLKTNSANRLCVTIYPQSWALRFEAPRTVPEDKVSAFTFWDVQPRPYIPFVAVGHTVA